MTDEETAREIERRTCIANKSEARAMLADIMAKGFDYSATHPLYDWWAMADKALCNANLGFAGASCEYLHYARQEQRKNRR